MCSPVLTIYFHCPDVARALCGRAYFTVLGHINPASPAPAKSRLAVSPRLYKEIAGCQKNINKKSYECQIFVIYLSHTLKEIDVSKKIGINVCFK